MAFGRPPATSFVVYMVPPLPTTAYLPMTANLLPLVLLVTTLPSAAQHAGTYWLLLHAGHVAPGSVPGIYHFVCSPKLP